VNGSAAADQAFAAICDQTGPRATAPFSSRRPADPSEVPAFAEKTGRSLPKPRSCSIDRPILVPKPLSMAEPLARLYLVTPPVDAAAAFAPRLAEACAAGDVAAVLARLAPADERTLINGVKTLAPAAQGSGAALVIEIPGEVDRATVATRGGADGVQVAGLPLVRALRERLKGDRIIGAGGLRTRDDAMTLGEAGVDYLMFGEPRPDGSLPAFDTVVERASWWAEIFETPCVAYAPSLEAVAPLAATGAEFVALGDAVWNHPDGPAAAVRQALEAIAAVEAVR